MAAELSKKDLLLKELDALDKERHEVDSHLREIATEERYLLKGGAQRNGDLNKDNRTRTQERERDGRPAIKRARTAGPPAKRPTPRSVNNDKMVDEEKEEGETTDDAKPNQLSSVVVNEEEGEATGIEKKPKQKPVKDAVFTRNKRMFGTLLGHLAKAQTRLKTDQKQANARKEAEERAAKKMEEYQQQVREKHLAELLEKRAKEKAQMEKIVKEHEEKEVALLEIVLAEHVMKTSEYIRTKVTPRLLWIPATHNEKTTKLLEDCKQEEVKRASSGSLVVAKASASDLLALNGKANTGGKDKREPEEKPGKDEDGDESMKTETSKDGSKTQEKDYSVDDDL